MKTKLTLELEVPDGATHYASGADKTLMWFKPAACPEGEERWQVWSWMAGGWLDPCGGRPDGMLPIGGTAIRPADEERSMTPVRFSLVGPGQAAEEAWVATHNSSLGFSWCFGRELLRAARAQDGWEVRDGRGWPVLDSTVVRFRGPGPHHFSAATGGPK